MKLTSPITAILYITADKQHMEELKHTIHVAEVVEGEFIYFYLFMFVFATEFQIIHRNFFDK